MNLRAVNASFRHQFLQFVADPQWIIPSIIVPFLFTAVMLYMNTDVTEPIVLQAILGGGVLGMWANTLFSSSYTISYDRMNGTMESILLSPAGMYGVVIGRSVWNAFIGLLNMLLVYLFAKLVFATPLTIADPLAFVIILAVTMFSLASVGTIFALSFVLTRRGYVLTAIFEYPIYVLSGAVVPITDLPVWMQPISMFLAPAWGVEALRESVITGYVGTFGFGMIGNALVCAGISALLLFISWILMKKIVDSIRATGSFMRY